MKLPNAEKAFVDIEKLRGYCLNQFHERGKHKARLFSSILGFTWIKYTHEDFVRLTSCYILK